MWHAWTIVPLLLLQPNAAELDAEIRNQIHQVGGKIRVVKTDGNARVHLLFHHGFNQSPLTAGLFRRFREMPNLVGLEVIGSTVEEDAFAELDDLPALETLKVSGICQAASTKARQKRIDECGLGKVKRLPWLRTFEIRGCPFRVDDLAFLKKCPEIERVLLDGFGDDAARHLAGLPKLADVDFGDSSKLTDDGMASLGAIPSLAKLRISSALVTDVGMARLGRAKKLTSLKIEKARLTGAGFGPIAAAGLCVDMELLHIDGRALDGKGLTSLFKAFPNLRELKLGTVTLADADFEGLRFAGKLTKLELTGESVGDGAFAHLPDKTPLAELRVPRSAIKGVSHLRKATALTRLELSGNPLAEDSTTGIASLKSLTYLALDGTPLTDGAAEKLAGLPNLRNLSLAKTKVTGRFLAAFAGHEDLRWLGLDLTECNDEGLEHLTRIPRLSGVNLAGTRCSPAAVSSVVQRTGVLIYRLGPIWPFPAIP